MLQNFNNKISMYNIVMNFINDILKKNLDYIKKYDEDLCSRLSSITQLSPHIQLIYTEKNEANLAYYNQPINEQSGAIDEATRLVKSLTHNNQSSIHVIIGMGFGYVFSKLVDVSKGRVILYEPNLELLRVALEMVDLSEYLSKSNVFITDNLDSIEKHFDNCFVPSSKTAILGCNYYRSNKSEELKNLINKLSHLQGIYETNTKQRAKEGGLYTCHVCYNLHTLSKSSPISIFKNSLKNKPAIIAAAGPSLGENLDVIKKYRNKFILFGVSSSLGTLINNDIFPEYVSIIEKFNSSGLVKDFPLENISLIAEPYTNLNVLNLPFKERIITSSCENSANEIYNQMFNLDNFYFETKGTVAYNALYSAMYMGCNPIIIVGQDLAYVDGECYSKNSPLSAYKCRKTDSGWEVYVSNMEELTKNLYPKFDVNDERVKTAINKRIQSLNTQLVVAKTISGEEIATSTTFSLFAEYYKTFAKEYSKKIKLYNTSNKGIDIGNFEYKPLEVLVKDLDDIDLTEHSATKATPLKLNTTLFEKEFLYIEEVYNKVTEDRKYFLDLNSQITENNFNLKNVLELIKKLMTLYVSINNDYYNKSLVYKEITIASKYAFANLEKYLDFNNKENLKEIFEILSVFYEKDYLLIERVLKYLKCVNIRFKNESSITKS